MPASDALKAQCDFFKSHTAANPKCQHKLKLTDLVLTNMPAKFNDSGVYSNDVSDHCAIAVVRDMRIPKSMPRLVEKHI